MATAFVNDAKPAERKDWMRDSQYGFHRAPKLLFQWSRLFQRVISQAGTYYFTKKFHDKDCGIYKSEGGCRIDGRGELVLTSNCCYWNYGDHGEKAERDSKAMSDLITAVVMAWEPTDPIESMVKAAAEFVGCDVAALKAALEQSSCGGVFGGDSLSSFFDWNPFGEPPYDRAYRRWCMVKFGDKTEKEADQIFADEDLGKSLLKRMQVECRNRHGHYGLYVMCCSPSRSRGQLSFWINTGRCTNLDGWKSQKEIEAWLSSGKPLVDKAKW